MRASRALLLLAAAWFARGDAGTSVQICGRELANILSSMCQVYNSPAWVDAVKEHSTLVRRKRADRINGIATRCCTSKLGCTWEELAEYCDKVEDHREREQHLIADRSAETDGTTTRAADRADVTAAAAAAAAAAEGAAGAAGAEGAAAEVGRRGYGRRGRRRCRCRRRRARAGRGRPSLMGNMPHMSDASRAAPVVGTVSPLLTWGRTLHAALPPPGYDRYAYIVVPARA